ncbi:MAG TPA: histidinol-phosphatase [Gemmatimonadaceae bacterium]|nr:histidinol-phosphatase [Gemmatimonadaceae bacterium]
MTAIATLMEAAGEVARLAGSIAREHFRPGIGVESKADGSPVTIADRSAEQAARAWIEHRFPDDGIIGEEFGVARPAARRRWIVDPIDGTRSFIRGVPLWGTLVAAAEGEDVLAGAAFFPATDEMLVAAPGCGCWWNGVRCRVSSVEAIAQAVVLTTDERFPARAGRHEAWTRLAERAALSRTWGDCYGYLLVATGRAEVMADDQVAPWDAAALVPIIEEAGGVFTDWKGVRTAFGGDSVATNAALARDARSLLGVPA